MDIGLNLFSVRKGESPLKAYQTPQWISQGSGSQPLETEGQEIVRIDSSNSNPSEAITSHDSVNG